eukprot:TRINITY_DN27260_c0_g1_i1.p1 TRINITY_DN27260_c0_g1~~TRINITY_DN27260_c0_g1_i1.p1  ORF type:complete len:109 (+),score=8.92 TRINITY_DN27260_c0_g1_i1:87-413(+)
MYTAPNPHQVYAAKLGTEQDQQHMPSLTPQNQHPNNRAAVRSITASMYHARFTADTALVEDCITFSHGSKPTSRIAAPKSQRMQSVQCGSLKFEKLPMFSSFPGRSPS